MRVTEVRVKLNGPSQDRLRGFCTITLDGAFVVRDIKIIDGPQGVFVAMPSRKRMDHCPRCRSKNHLRARYCNNCGTQLDENRYPSNAEGVGAGPAGAGAAGGAGKVKLHCDVAHPINAICRAMIQEAILKAYHDETERAKQPGYIPQRMEDVDDDLDSATALGSGPQ